MRKLFIICALIFSVGVGAQSNYLTSATSYELQCGDVVKKGTEVVIDTLIVSCFRTILLQDNARLEIGTVIWEPSSDADWTDEILRVMYGDVGWGDEGAPPESERVKLERFDMDGNPYFDYRRTTDVNPRVVFRECMPTGVFGDTLVDVDYEEYCPDITLGDEEFVVSPEDEMLLQCVIHDINGRKLYEGLFADIFNGSCGVGCLEELYWNKILLIEFRTETGIRIKVKRIYVR